MDKIKGLVLAGACVLAAPAALAEVSLPTVGVEVADYVTVAIASMGAVAGVAVGGYFAFLIIRRALRWGSRALG